jgi:hypothetical protein
MPNTRASFDLAVKIKHIGTAVQRGQKDAVFSASMIVKNEIEGNLVRAIGSEGQILVDLERAAVWHHKNGKETRLNLADDAGFYNCIGPIDSLMSAGRGEAFVNQSPGELGARTVEALDIAYRSAASGKLEHRI